MKSYLAVAGQVVGTMESGYRIEYHRLGVVHPVKDQAISEGFAHRGSDDFNVAEIKNGRIAALYWMDDVVDKEPLQMARIAKDIAL